MTSPHHHHSQRKMTHTHTIYNMTYKPDNDATQNQQINGGPLTNCN